LPAIAAVSAIAPGGYAIGSLGNYDDGDDGDCLNPMTLPPVSSPSRPGQDVSVTILTERDARM
jgi:hypothetical protein